MSTAIKPIIDAYSDEREDRDFYRRFSMKLTNYGMSALSGLSILGGVCVKTLVPKGRAPIAAVRRDLRYRNDSLEVPPPESDEARGLKTDQSHGEWHQPKLS